MPPPRAILALACAVLALAGFAPTFVLVTLTSFGAVGDEIGNGLLLADLAGALLAVAAAVGAFRRARWWRAAALAGGALGTLAAAGYLLATWPWTTEARAMGTLAALHAWALLLAATALAGPRADARRSAA